MRLTSFVLAAAASALATSAFSAPTLAPHRAVYDLVLDKASDKSGITSLNGRMVYEFNGSTCDGYTTSYRFVTRINTADASRLNDQQTSTFEDGAGKMFSFVTKSFIDSNLDTELKGTATAEPSGLNVAIERPAAQSVKLDKTQFPTQHLMELIDKAEKGETFYETNLFDGSEKGNKIMTTTVIVGKPAGIPETDPERKALGTLATDKSWPVDMAYFDLSKPGEEESQYRISFKLHENGVTRDLVMDYGEFSMKGQLVDLKLLPATSDCKP